MSAPFCATCNRLRLTSDGLLRSCLFDGGEVDIKPLLRGNAPPSHELLARAMAQCVALKPETHSAHGNQAMNRIGG
jgi:cyclic pyranopterin phosphate synthase